MLARTVLTPDELRISAEEHAALIAVRNKLASGEIPAERFNMCLTTICIGGWMNVESRRWWGYSPAFQPLFYRYGNIHSDNHTPAEAVAAIDRFLAGNTADPWEVGA